jgi:hypothetical protein
MPGGERAMAHADQGRGFSARRPMQKRKRAGSRSVVRKMGVKKRRAT